MPALALMVVGADFEFNVCNMYMLSGRSSSDQSVSGGILQTITKLCSTIGFGLAIAIFTAAQNRPPSTPGHQPCQYPPFVPSNEPHRHALPSCSPAPAKPHSAVFWYCTAAAGLSLSLVPFLTIQTQGRGPAKELFKRKAEDISGTTDTA